MLRIRTILHPTDLSEPSAAAFQVAYSLARDYGARLIALYVAPMSVVYGGTMPGVPTDPEVTLDALQERLNQFQAPDDQEDVHHLLREGDAATEILAAADDLKVDLIVMGSHGRTGLTRILMGSVAEEVLRRAGCPVLIVRGSIRQAASRPHATAGGFGVT